MNGSEVHLKKLYRYKPYNSILTLFFWVGGGSGSGEISENWPKHIEAYLLISIPFDYMKLRVKYILGFFYFFDLSWSVRVMELNGQPLGNLIHCGTLW